MIFLESAYIQCKIYILNMLKQERFNTILEALESQNFVSLHDLMQLTSSSESTIRADLIELSNSNKLIRLRGGAQAINNESVNFELDVERKMNIEVQAKREIAKYAASLIPNNSIIYIDAGSSTYYLTNFIESKKVKIITSSVIIAKRFKEKGFQTYIVGGEFKLTTDTFIGPMTQEILHRFNFDIGFFGTNGIDLEQGLTTPDIEEAMVKKTAMRQCKKIYVLADHSKFGIKTSIAFHPFVPEEIITDIIYDESFKNKQIKEVNK